MPATCRYVPASNADAKLLFDLIGQAYGRQSLSVTANLPFENWTDVLGSERLTHRCHILEFTGESYCPPAFAPIQKQGVTRLANAGTSRRQKTNSILASHQAESQR